MIEFTDAKGRTWHPRVTARVLRDFEQQTGIGVFDAVFQIAAAIPADIGATDPKTGMPTALPASSYFEVAGKLFGKVGNVLYLLYEACRPFSAGALADPFTLLESGEKVPVSRDDFYDAIGKEQIGPALNAAMASFLEFFPQLDDTTGTAEGGGAGSEDSKRPFAPSLGETFTKSLQSRASSPGTIPSEK